MLTPIAPGIWHAQRSFTIAGIAATSRMTVIQLADGGLWLHSPILIDDALRAALAAIGPVHYVVAPNKVHHLFAKKCLAMYPQARLFGAPGLEEKRPDLVMTPLGLAPPPEWAGAIGQVFMAGIPRLNETVFFHVASGTTIFTDICQFWTGPLGWKESLLAHLTGVRKALTVPRTVRLIIQDKAALRTSALQVLAWPVQRVVVSHNSVIDTGAHAALKRALGTI